MADNSDLAYTQNYHPDTVYTNSFNNGKGKYISVAHDSSTDENKVSENTRTKITATFIRDKNKVVGLKLTRYTKQSGTLLPDPECFNLPLEDLMSLKGFCEFLDRSDLESLASKTITFGESITFDDDTSRKLYTLGQSDAGKDLLKTVIEQLVDNSSNLDSSEMIKFGLTANKIKQKQAELNAFEAVIDKPDVKEVSEVQAELKKIPWIFGPEYTSYDFRPAGEAGLPDGRLKRVDGLSDILEVKLPSEELLRTGNGRHYISPKCSEAIGQLTSYLEYYHSAYTTNRDDESGEERLEDDFGRYYKPKGILLIGRRIKSDGVKTTGNTADNDPKFMRRLLSYYHWIEILTYDDLLERARNGLLNLSK